MYTSSTANERDPSHADSDSVFRGKQYLSHGITMDFNDDLVGYESTVPRVYLDFGSASGTVEITVEYDYQE